MKEAPTKSLVFSPRRVSNNVLAVEQAPEEAPNTPLGQSKRRRQVTADDSDELVGSTVGHVSCTLGAENNSDDRYATPMSTADAASSEVPPKPTKRPAKRTRIVSVKAGLVSPLVQTRILRHRVSLNGEGSSSDQVGIQMDCDNSSIFLRSLSTPTLSMDDEEIECFQDDESLKTLAMPSHDETDTIDATSLPPSGASLYGTPSSCAVDKNVAACVSPAPPALSTDAIVGASLVAPIPAKDFSSKRHPAVVSLDLEHHAISLRRESALFPLRALLSRLMSHTSNRRGLFNSPVDYVALGLADYTSVITRPMDLGTVKSRLQALAYTGPEEFASDVRLVFVNAMRYNPPQHIVHKAAKALLGLFERGYSAVISGSSTPSSIQQDAVISLSSSASGGHSTRATTSLSGSCSPNALPTGGDPGNGGSLCASSPVDTPMTSLKSSFPAGDLTTGCISEANLSAASIAYSTIGGQTQTTASKSCLHAAEICSANSKGNEARHTKYHSCSSCMGDTCALCLDGCLSLEPTLIICSGNGCGQKIRKASTYYVAKDGTVFYCPKCFANLSAITQIDFEDSGCGDNRTARVAVRYKRDLLRRKHEEEIVEKWIQCSQCARRMHQICAMYNPLDVSQGDFVCPICMEEVSRWSDDGRTGDATTVHDKAPAIGLPDEDVATAAPLYTFVSGDTHPKRIQISRSISPWATIGTDRAASELPKCEIAKFLETKVRQRMSAEGFGKGAGKTVTVRVISDVKKSFGVPESIRRHFRMETESAMMGSDSVPANVSYTSKAIMLFQTIDGVDVCIYCMYVHEYDDPLQECDGNEESRTGERCHQQKQCRSSSSVHSTAATSSLSTQSASRGKRVYIAYLDSVDYFRPRECRTAVYQEILVAYLASARKRGYHSAHIWACPPMRGNSFIFWSHPVQQRTPTHDRLRHWYNKAIARCVDTGTVTDVTSLYDVAFAQSGGKEKHVAPCPPLLEGDFWMEHAVKVYRASIARHLKSHCSMSNVASASSALVAENMEEVYRQIPCPVGQVAALLQNVILPHPSSLPFRRPVNAAALKLFDYHDVISRPMDLGTINARCFLGDFDTLSELISDVELVVANAMQYNPPGHPVHTLAGEMKQLFFDELERLCQYWGRCTVQTTDGVCLPRKGSAETPAEHKAVDIFRGMSMRLNVLVVELDDTGTEDENVDLSENPGEENIILLPTTRMPSESSSKLDFEPNARNGPSSAARSIDGVEAVFSLPAPMDTGSCCGPKLSEGKAELPTAAVMKRPTCAVSSGVLPPTGQIQGEGSSAKAAPSCTPNSADQKAAPKLCLIRDGTNAIAQRMIGEDDFLLDSKKSKLPNNGKKKNKNKKHSLEGDSAEHSVGGGSSIDGSAAKLVKRESWLADEVGASVRKMRRDFFVCNLLPKADGDRSEMEVEMLTKFAEYTDSIAVDENEERIVNSEQKTVERDSPASSLADARHALLDVSQLRNYQFDTLRRAKYSSSMLLFHLHNPQVPGLMPECSRCDLEIADVRWHRIKGCTIERTELCSECYSLEEDPSNFVPLRVSFVSARSPVEKRGR